MASCGIELIIFVCQSRCTSITSGLWIVQSDKACVDTGVIMCICVGKCNCTSDELYTYLAKRRGMGSLCAFHSGTHRLAFTVLPCVQRVTAYVCAFKSVCEER